MVPISSIKFFAGKNYYRTQKFKPQEAVMRKTNLFFAAALLPILLIFYSTESIGEDESMTASGIRVEDAVICRDVVSLDPVGSGDVFTSDLKKLMCFTRVVGAKEDIEILHNWYFEENLLASIPLHVGSDNWRTYSSKTILPEHKGEWKVEIVMSDGQLLKKIYFIVE
jgi:hypothetical protein